MTMDAAAAATLLTGNGQSRALQSAGRAAGLGALSVGQAMTPSQADRVSKDFEALFIGQMLEQMFGESIGDLFGDKDAREVYKGMMVEEYGKQIVKSGGIGIADYVKRELLALQEVGQ